MNEEKGEDEINESGYSNSCGRKSEQRDNKKKNDRVSSSNEDSQIRSQSNKNEMSSPTQHNFSKYKGSIEKSDDFLLCSKCIKMSQLTKTGCGGFADILLNTKTVENFFEPGTFHKEYSVSIAQKLINLKAHDFRTMPSYELTIFEHVLLYRFWYKLIEQCYRRKCHEDLYQVLL